MRRCPELLHLRGRRQIVALAPDGAETVLCAADPAPPARSVYVCDDRGPALLHGGTELRRRDLASGGILWTCPTGSPVIDLDAEAGVVHALCADGTLLRADAADGRLLARHRLPPYGPLSLYAAPGGRSWSARPPGRSCAARRPVRTARRDGPLGADAVAGDLEVAGAAQDRVLTVGRRVLQQPRVLQPAGQLAQRQLRLLPGQRGAEAAVDAAAQAQVLDVGAVGSKRSGFSNRFGSRLPEASISHTDAPWGW